MKKLHLFPGTLCTEKLWQRLAPYLQPDFTLQHCPIPNHLSFSEMSQHFLNTLIQNDILDSRSPSTQEKRHLIGFSLGGYAAAHFATRYPQWVASLTVVSNSPTVLPEQEVQQRMTALEYVKQHGYRGSSKQRLGQLLAPENRHDTNLALLQEMDKAIGEVGFLSQYEHTTDRDDLAEPLLQMSFPIQFVFANQDPLVDHQWMAQFEARAHAQAPNIAFHRTPGSGHMLPLEQTQSLSNIIKQFI